MTCVAPDAPGLRGSVSKWMSQNALLNHARERMEATHDVHDYIDQKREALEKWAKYLEGLRDIQRSA
jgi:predicted NBD/HSP70 family sugar kinase